MSIQGSGKTFLHSFGGPNHGHKILRWGVIGYLIARPEGRNVVLVRILGINLPEYPLHNINPSASPTIGHQVPNYQINGYPGIH